MNNAYQVQKGDSLSSIANRNGLTLGELLKANPQFSSAGRNPNMIQVGEPIQLPQRAFSPAQPAGAPVQMCPVQAPAVPAGNAAITNSAYKMIGTSTADVPGTQDGKLGCAAAVSMMFKDATGEDILPGKPMVLGTGQLYDGLSNDPRFEKIPLEDAQPGDIVVTARGTEAGHTGIVGNNNEIISNSSSGFQGADPGTIQNNYTVASWQKNVTPRNPDKTSAFRYIGPETEASK